MEESEASRRRREIFPFFWKWSCSGESIFISKRQHETNHHVEARERFFFPFGGWSCDGEELFQVEPDTKSSWSNEVVFFYFLRIGEAWREAVLRIHDILGWIRIRIRGSMPLTNGSGFGSFYFRHWPSRSRQKTKFLTQFFLRIFFLIYIYITFQR